MTEISMKKRLSYLFVFLLVFIGIGIHWFYTDPIPKFPDYSIDLSLPSPQLQGKRGVFRVGADKTPITPKIVDTFIDFNGDSLYHPIDRDSYQDNNENGRFDAVWLAGFDKARPAKDIHDELWARTLVVDNGSVRIAMVALDLIGLFYQDVITIRKSLDSDLKIDHVIVASTHNHQGPDTLGLWGPNLFTSGVDKEYLSFVKNRIISSIEKATKGMVEAKVTFASGVTGKLGYFRDSRRPYVMDDSFSAMKFTSLMDNETIAVVVNWSNHPEALGDRNNSISSDFPHYLRETLEKGIECPRLLEGLGGIAIFFNGSVGGLMTPLELMVPDRDGRTLHMDEGFSKAKALGENVAEKILEALKNSTAHDTNPEIRLRAKTIFVPMGNQKFRLMAKVGVIDRGLFKKGLLRTEIDGVNIGKAQMLILPGEIYPEIMIGGIINPSGADYRIKPVEVPPLKEAIKGEFKFVIGLGNDEIGYIIPKSEWDKKRPYLYHSHEPPYGEINSIGPETGPIIYREALNLLRKLS